MTGAAPFDGKAWCDDHNCIEPDIGSRLMEAYISLWSAMIAVLGPASCNGEKFTPWFVSKKALGLEWDLARQTKSMTEQKIQKATRRTMEMLQGEHTTRIKLHQLLGTLRRQRL